MKPGVAIPVLVAILLLGPGADDPRAESPRWIGLPAASRWTAPAAGRWQDPFAVGDTVEIVARRVPLLGCGGLCYAPAKDPLAALRTSTVHPSFAAGLDGRKSPPAVPLLAMPPPSTVESSRFSRLVLGADLGAGTVSSLAGLGLVTGVWGEKTAGYLMGAGAILGALWGGTIGADNSALRVRVGLDDPAARWDRYRFQPDETGRTGPPR